MQTEQADVVGGVADHRDLGVGVALGELAQEASQEARGADAAGQRCDAKSGHGIGRY